MVFRHPGRSLARSVLISAVLALSLLLPLVAAADIEVVDQGDEVPAIRYAGATRFETAALIATDDSRSAADFARGTVIVALGDDFADALSASYVAGLTDAPVLLVSREDVTDPTREALAELAPDTIIVVGGAAAVSDDLVTELETYAPVTRVAGQTRAGTAAAIARLGDVDEDGALDDGGTTAVLASGQTAFGALSAGPLSAARGMPLLLSDPDSLSPEVGDALQALGITDVIVAGHSGTVSHDVVGELAKFGVSVTRVGDDTASGTSVAFADLTVSQYGFTANHVNIATGEDFADALALAAHAAVDHLGPAPILLTEGEDLGEASSAFLAQTTSCGLLALHIAGGTAAVSDDVLAAARGAATPTDACSTEDTLLALTSAESAYVHLEAFQAIADANDGTRASGTPGYDASVDYVAAQLNAAGYEVTIQDFAFDLFEELSPTQVLIDGVELTEEQALIMSYSGSGDVTGTTELVDADLGAGNPGTGEANDGDSDSGCEPEDFEGFTDGAIALIQRGSCAFGLKALNAFEAGASAAIVFNQGHDEENSVVVAGTLGGEVDPDFPVIGMDVATGLSLAEDPQQVVRIVTETSVTPETSSNVIADSPWGDPDDVVMLGAHLDSVQEGPGIQDNGTGSAGILDVALQLANAEIETTNRVRFAWWGAEESGLVGSNAYIFGDGADLEGISDEEYEALKLYLNFDMIGSPNYMRGVYDGDGDAFELEGPPGSDHIEASFIEHFDAQGLPSVPTEFSGRSDYQAFINVGIPAGGLFTGAEGLKTEEEAELFGGEAGVAYDSCYHQACDAIDNVNLEVMDQNIDAIAALTLQYGDSLAGIPARPVEGEEFAGRGTPLVGHVEYDADHDHGHGDYNERRAS